MFYLLKIENREDSVNVHFFCTVKKSFGHGSRYPQGPERLVLKPSAFHALFVFRVNNFGEIIKKERG